MRKAIALCVLGLFVCGAAHGLDFTWTAGAVSQFYDNAQVWNVGVTYPHNSSDTMTLGTAGATLKTRAGSYNWGSLNVTAGTLNMAAAGNGSVYKFSADNGGSGDFIVGVPGVANSGTINGYLNSPNISTLDVAGDLRTVRPGAQGVWNSGNDKHYWNVIMRGGTAVTSKVLADNYTDWWQTVTIAPGAYVTTGASGTPATAKQVNLVVNGTITGGTWLLTQAAPSVSMGVGGQWTAGKLLLDLTNMTGSIGGGTYYQIDTYGGGGPPNPFRRTFRLKGNVTTTSDFTYNKGTWAYQRDWVDVLDTDNGSGTISNLTVNGNFTAGGNTGGPTTPWTTVYYGIKANSSTITIAGNSLFDTYAYVKGGTSKWNFRGNVSFTSQFKFDNTDMTGTAVTINGAGAQTLAFGQKLKLGNLTINKPSGTATLTDNVLLTGNFRLDAGTLAPGGKFVMFKGGKNTQSTAENVTMASGSLDKMWVMAGSPTFVQLQSNLTVNTLLTIDNGCAIVLNGKTLTVGATPYTTTQTYGQGMLYATWGDVSAIPEPGTLLLLGTGAIGVLGLVRRRRMK